jgi:hypothetical protein
MALEAGAVQTQHRSILYRAWADGPTLRSRRCIGDLGDYFLNLPSQVLLQCRHCGHGGGFWLQSTSRAYDDEVKPATVLALQANVLCDCCVQGGTGSWPREGLPVWHRPGGDASVLGGLTIHSASGGVIPVTVTVAVAAAPFLSPGETGQRLDNHRTSLPLHRTDPHRAATPPRPCARSPTSTLATSSLAEEMLASVATLLLGASLAAAQASFTDLVGTWSSKSNSTMTGPVRNAACFTLA